MKKLTGLLLSVALVAPLWAQDSVTNQDITTPTPPTDVQTDALDPFDTTEQVNDYVVDMATFTSGWGHDFAIAPIIKASATSPGEFPSDLISAQSMSRLQALGVEAPAEAYDFWQDDAPGTVDGVTGTGVNPVANFVPGATLSPAGLTNQFGVTFGEFGTQDTGYNGIIGAVVNYDPAAPLRLYVRRVVAAQNACAVGTTYSSFGIGAVDETGTITFRADDNEIMPFGGASCSSGLTPWDLDSQNIFRVRTLPVGGDAGRDASALNVISFDYPGGLYDAPATDWVVQDVIEFVPDQGDYNVYNVPNMMPFDVGGAKQFYLGSNFTSEYCRGRTATVTEDTSHYPAGANDHRGALSYLAKNFRTTTFNPDGTHGIAAILSKLTVAPFDTRGISVFSLDSNADVSDSLLLAAPTARLKDNGTNVYENDRNGDPRFDHYHGQTAFRGGVSQVGMNVDPSGNLLVAAQMEVESEIGVPGAAKNDQIAVARVAPDGTIEWTLAAYTIGLDGPASLTYVPGKEILAGPGGAAIGRLTQMQQLTGGGATSADYPSVSAPMIDAAGNVWFLGVLYTFGDNGVDDGGEFNLGEGKDDQVTIGLVRAVYDAATFSYELELVLKSGIFVGDSFPGLNSGCDYLLRFLTVSNIRSDNVGSGTTWSQNMSENAHLGGAFTGTESTDPTALGGLVFQAQLIYDRDGDGDFNDPDDVEGHEDADTRDEAYYSVLYLSATEAAPTVTLCGDANCDGVVDSFDIDGFIAAQSGEAAWLAYLAGQGIDACDYLAANDITGDGKVDTFDIDGFISAVSAGACP